jgi:uncharacterized RDD family membrane protein YckC
MVLDLQNAASNNKPISVAAISGNYKYSIMVSRWLGAWIDFIVLAFFLLIPDRLLGNTLYRQTLFIWLGLAAAYFPVLESIFGKTAGKLVTHTRVVDSQGNNPSWKQSIIRTLFRLIEVNPFLLGGLPAGLVALVSSNRQRIGDLVADTYVLKDKDVNQIAAARNA